MSDDRWLTPRAQDAWRSLLVLVNRGLPQLDRTLKQHDLLVVHYGILVALSEAPERSLRLSELAAHANVSQSRLTHRLRRLTAGGEIEVTQCPDDARGKVATLTPTGRRRLEAIAPVHADDVQQLIFDLLDDDDVDDLARVLDKVARPLRDDPPPPLD